MRFWEIDPEETLRKYVYDEEMDWDEEIPIIQAQYGNVPVGTVYWGTKIHTREQLEKFRSLSGSTITVKTISASPDLSVAESYSQYHRSYDNASAMREYVAALRAGSAGQYGTAILTLKPHPDNVVAKMYQEGNEPSTWRYFSAPEREVILTGTIPVVDVSIMEPLTLENYREVISHLPSWENDFVKKWLDYWKIPIEDRVEMIHQATERYSPVEKARLLNLDTLWGKDAVARAILPQLPLSAEDGFIGVELQGVKYHAPLGEILPLIPVKELREILNKSTNMSFIKAILGQKPELLSGITNSALEAYREETEEMAMELSSVGEIPTEEEIIALRDRLWVFPPQKRRKIVSGVIARMGELATGRLTSRDANKVRSLIQLSYGLI